MANRSIAATDKHADTTAPQAPDALRFAVGNSRWPAAKDKSITKPVGSEVVKLHVWLGGALLAVHGQDLLRYSTAATCPYTFVRKLEGGL